MTALTSLPSIPSRFRQTTLIFCGIALLTWVFARQVDSQSRKPSAGFRITGTVVNAKDSSPVPRCHMTAALSTTERGGPRDLIQADCDARGHFAIEVPSAGNWRLSTSAHNIRFQALDEHEGFFTAVVLTDARPTYDVQFRATPDAVLSGFVTDDAGEPVRNAELSLFELNDASRETETSPVDQREGTQTDDRGHFEFASLAPGKYTLNVRARPWYSLGGGRGPALAASAATSTPSPDPSLDFVYPVTWYPGVTDGDSAGVITAHPGDALQSDFRLTPVPSAHLLLPAQTLRPLNQPQNQNQPTGDAQIRGRVQAPPRISILLPNGVVQQVFGDFSMRTTSSGQIDMGGLAPGTYQVTFQGDGNDGQGHTSIMKVREGGSVTDLSAAEAETTVTLSLDGTSTLDASRVSLIDTETRRSINSFGSSGRFGGGPQFGPGQLGSGPGGFGGSPGHQGGPGQGPSQREGSRGRSSGGPSDVTLHVPPGKYEISIPGNAQVFLTGITASGAEANGRGVTIKDVPAHITIHLAPGLASVDGIATFEGKPAVGAMMLLVPATFGQPSSLTVVRRDQSNTDGSFHMTGVIPGQYILIGVNRGWGVNWRDAATLRGYLLQGMPLELASAASVHSDVHASAP